MACSPLLSYLHVHPEHGLRMAVACCQGCTHIRNSTACRCTQATAQAAVIRVQVFKDAEHSRYSHCLGVAHLSRKLVQSLRTSLDERLLQGCAWEDVCPTEEEELQVCLAGLVHDLGHAFLSHLGETIIKSAIDGWCDSAPTYSCDHTWPLLQRCFCISGVHLCLCINIAAGAIVVAACRVTRRTDSVVRMVAGSTRR